MQGNPDSFIARIIQACFCLAFGGIGITVLGAMWLSPFGAFGSPPLFFRIFASFITIPFIAIGIGGLYSVITGKMLNQSTVIDKIRELKQQTDQTSEREIPNQLICPSCGAPKSEEEVSPSGDVKCAHCQRWYNIYSTDV